jgi:uncharacterized protein involved in cysteine biosynthesis
MKEFLGGARAYWRAWQLAWRANMWPLLLVPGIISAIYFPAVVLLSYFYGGRVALYIRNQWLPEILRRDVYVVVVTVVLAVLGLYLGFVLFRNVVMILYSPVLGFLSRKTEERTRRVAGAPLESGGLAKETVRAVTMSLTSLTLVMGLFAVSVVLLIIPVAGEIGMLMVLPVSQMFLAGHGFVDPTLERRGFGVGQSFRFAWRHRYRLLGCGCVFVVMTTVPLLGWFLGPTLGIIAGTLIALETLEAPANEQSADNHVPAIGQ